MQKRGKRFVVGFAPKSRPEDVIVSRKIRSGALKIPIRELLASKGVRRTPRGIVVDFDQALKGKMTRAARKLFIALEYGHTGTMKANVERIKLMKQLKALGYGVFTPRYKIKGLIPEGLYSRVFGTARVFPARAVEGNNAWMRDLWAKVGERRIKNMRTFGEDKLGEGGRSIVFGKVILATKSLKNHLTLDVLRELGYKVHFLESGFAYEKRLSGLVGENVLIRHSHVDLFLGVVGKIMLVEGAFYRQNKSVLNQVSRENGLKIVFVPKSEQQLRPANFLVLEENKVLVDRDAKETISLLKQNGVEVIQTATSIRHNQSIGGGVRCIVNEL